AYWAVAADLAWNLAARGYVDEAHAWVEEARQRAEATSRQVAGLAAVDAGLLATLGRTAEAREQLAAARRGSDETPDERWRVADTLGWEALVYLELGDAARSVEVLAAARRALKLTPRG